MKSWLGSFVIFKGSGPVLLRMILMGRGGGSGPPVPPLDQSMEKIEGASTLTPIYLYTCMTIIKYQHYIEERKVLQTPSGTTHQGP